MYVWPELYVTELEGPFQIYLKQWQQSNPGSSWGGGESQSQWLIQEKRKEKKHIKELDPPPPPPPPPGNILDMCWRSTVPQNQRNDLCSLKLSFSYHAPFKFYHCFPGMKIFIPVSQNPLEGLLSPNTSVISKISAITETAEHYTIGYLPQICFSKYSSSVVQAHPWSLV